MSDNVASSKRITLRSHLSRIASIKGPHKKRGDSAYYSDLARKSAAKRKAQRAALSTLADNAEPW